MRPPFSLALRAARHHGAANLLNALTLAAVLAPLLILYGLKSGIVDGMIADLTRDPNLLSIGIASHRPLTEADVAALRTDPTVGFVVGAPRSLAAELDMMRAGDRDIVRAAWLPSGPGDPLLPGVTLGEDGIALSAPLAEALGAGVGDEVVGTRYRNADGEAYDVLLTVAAVLPRTHLSGMRALVPQETVNRIAAFSDGYAIPSAGIDGKPLSQREALYDRLRLYAASIDDVAPLERTVTALGFRTSSNAAQILWVRELESVMGGVFAIIAVAGSLSYALTLWATVAANVRQLAPDLSLLRLLGMPAGALAAFPLGQVALVTTAGLAVALAVAFAMQAIINALFLREAFASGVCVIRVQHVALALGATLIIGSVVALANAARMGRIEPSTALQEGLT